MDKTRTIAYIEDDEDILEKEVELALNSTMEENSHPILRLALLVLGERK